MLILDLNIRMKGARQSTSPLKNPTKINMEREGIQGRTRTIKLPTRDMKTKKMIKIGTSLRDLLPVLSSQIRAGETTCRNFSVSSSFTKVLSNLSTSKLMISTQTIRKT